MDGWGIHTRDIVSPTIITSIHSALVHITIFSTRYVESSWGLNESCWIMSSYHDGKGKIILIYFDVEPKDLYYIREW